MALLWKCFVNKCSALILVLAFSLSSFAVEFPKKNITLGGKTLVVEVAETPAQHERGLMYRDTLAENDGMLFIFKNEETRFFWMKNTLIDLAIAYFNKDGELIDIQEMKSGKGVTDTMLPSYPSSLPAKYALEMNKGWFAKNKIRVGSKLKIK
ncbi:DUF192 domain-containing protein [Bdellovibrio reynosensis]|uniref:DUF192 domain-containing protein n=1 Tax=Bdellovibrio reynosensis TaxID=2835041 RepID=A0ABY4CDR8_9BACT|nr:DUF192 domain-containing protein [Bdellovibrio reynosensis]UOF00340.1 DUF192 domain-containing protein [Bdellovibrio reynosensis]